MTGDSVVLMNKEETVVWKAPSSADSETVSLFPPLLNIESGRKWTAVLHDWYWDKKESFIDTFTQSTNGATEDVDILERHKFSTASVSPHSRTSPSLSFRQDVPAKQFNKKDLLRYSICEGQLVCCTICKNGCVTISGDEPGTFMQVRLCLEAENDTEYVWGGSFCATTGRCCYVVGDNRIAIVNLFDGGNYQLSTKPRSQL